MATARQVVLPNGEAYTFADWGDYMLWSRAEIAQNAAQDIMIFNYTAGQPIPGGGAPAGFNATVLDTNMPAPGQLPLRSQMIVFACGIRYDECDSNLRGAQVQQPLAGDGLVMWYTIAHNVFFQLIVEQGKPYIEGISTQFPAGGGLYFSVTNATAGALVEAYVPNNGNPGAHAARRLSLPIHLAAMETFYGKFSFPRGALNFLNVNSLLDYGLTVVLSGPRQRAVG